MLPCDKAVRIGPTAYAEACSARGGRPRRFFGSAIASVACFIHAGFRPRRRWPWPRLSITRIACSTCSRSAFNSESILLISIAPSYLCSSASIIQLFCDDTWGQFEPSKTATATADKRAAAEASEQDACLGRRWSDPLRRGLGDLADDRENAGRRFLRTTDSADQRSGSIGRPSALSRWQAPGLFVRSRRGGPDGYLR